MKNRLKTTTLLALAMAISAASSQAVYIFTSPNQTITETFTDYAGTAAPANWALNAPHETSGVQAGYAGQLGSASSTAIGWRSYGTTSPAVSDDRSLGFLGNGSYGSNTTTNVATMTAAYTNSTGISLTGISVGYTGEQWLAQNSRTSKITVSYSLDGTTFISLTSLTFLAPNIPSSAALIALDGNSPENRIVFSPLAINLTATPIADGSTFYLRFNYDGGSSGGNRQGLSIDDVSVSVVPEPATTALLFGAGLLVLVYRCRQRSKLS